MNWTSLIQQKRTTRILFVCNVLISFAVFVLFKNQTGGDALTYIGLADGILEGKYSYWYFLDDYYPDTFRNPGYPLFLALIRLFTKSIFVIQVVQLILYVLSIRMVLSLIQLLTGKIEISNIFLLLLFPALYVSAYTTMLFPEILVTALLLAALLLNAKWKEGSVGKFIILGLLYGYIFQIRPAFLFVPFIFFIHSFLSEAKSFRWIHQSALIVVFLITMIPYGLWNLKNHGVFKVTSIEGGGGVFHLGYWSSKLPDYYVTHYWNNYCTEEMVPMIDTVEKEMYVSQFNEEWEEIEIKIAPFLTKKDSAMIEIQKQYPGLFATLGSAYTLKREELLKSYTIENIRKDLSFYLKAKSYGAARLWVTGIPMKEFRDAGISKKLFLIYPFLITLVTFLFSIVLIPFAFRRNKQLMKKFTPVLLLILYFGMIHVPFTIQSRYTIPVRIELLMILATAIYILFLGKVRGSRIEN